MKPTDYLLIITILGMVCASIVAIRQSRQHKATITDLRAKLEQAGRHTLIVDRSQSKDDWHKISVKFYRVEEKDIFDAFIREWRLQHPEADDAQVTIKRREGSLHLGKEIEK